MEQISKCSIQHLMRAPRTYKDDRIGAFPGVHVWKGYGMMSAKRVKNESRGFRHGKGPIPRKIIMADAERHNDFMTRE